MASSAFVCFYHCTNGRKVSVGAKVSRVVNRARKRWYFGLDKFYTLGASVVV